MLLRHHVYPVAGGRDVGEACEPAPAAGRRDAPSRPSAAGGRVISGLGSAGFPTDTNGGDTAARNWSGSVGSASTPDGLPGDLT